MNKLPEKFYIVINSIMYLLLSLSFLYLLIAVLNKYGVWFSISSYITLLIPLLGSIATVILAILTLGMVKEMKKAREEDRRPYVFVDFVFDSSVIMLFIKNSGRNGAKDVSFKFSPQLVSTDDKISKLSELSLFKNGIKFLPPDREIKTWFDMAPALFSSALPKAYKVQVQYRDVVSNQEYNEEFELDLNTHLGITTVGKKTIEDIAIELERIRNVLSSNK